MSKFFNESIDNKIYWFRDGKFYICRRDDNEEDPLLDNAYLVDVKQLDDYNLHLFYGNGSERILDCKAAFQDYHIQRGNWDRMMRDNNFDTVHVENGYLVWGEDSDDYLLKSQIKQYSKEIKERFTFPLPVHAVSATPLENFQLLLKYNNGDEEIFDVKPYIYYDKYNYFTIEEYLECYGEDYGPENYEINNRLEFGHLESVDGLFEKVMVSDEGIIYWPKEEVNCEHCWCAILPAYI